MKFMLLITCIAILFTLPVLARDSDNDGIPNKYDECKREPEDIDNFEDNDGCPDYDNDKDGILDASDKCREIPEDLDGFEDHDGCPEIDNDKDGIPDNSDKCPIQAEDFDAFEDTDGCPDNDNDKDGIPDAADKCKSDAEDRDNFEDEDGCPEFDNDKDGIRDSVDKCPMEAETYNDRDDSDGCPDVAIFPLKEFEVFSDIDFRTGTDELTYESHRPLGIIAKKLKAYPKHQITIKIFRRFTINISNSLDLLGRQHRAIVAYLVENGVPARQIRRADFSKAYYTSMIKGTQDDYNQVRPIEILRHDFYPETTPKYEYMDAPPSYEEADY